jgi:hypothetical protein
MSARHRAPTQTLRGTIGRIADSLGRAVQFVIGTPPARATVTTDAQIAAREFDVDH